MFRDLLAIIVMPELWNEETMVCIIFDCETNLNNGWAEPPL